MNFRLAVKGDLPKLKAMFIDIVKNMDINNIHIWNEYYPYEEFENDIQNKNLYLITDKNNIIATIGLFDTFDVEDCFEWNDKNAKVLYVSRLGVNVNYLRQGIGNLALQNAIKIAKDRNYKYLRLLVADINKPAINLYTKNGFCKVNGIRNEYSEILKKTISELGLEIEL